MNTQRAKNIVVSLFAALILFFLLRSNENGSPVEVPGAHTSYPSFDSDRLYSSSTKGHRYNSNLIRHETLQKKVKGYRESTYWGVEHPIQEETKDLSDEEFDRFIKEEVEQKDEDVYWDAEY